MCVYCVLFHIVPQPLIKLSISNNQLQVVGQSLTLESTVTTVRGITSRLDIVWSRDGFELDRVEGLNQSSTINDSVLYTKFYIIAQLNTLDEARIFMCDIIINTISPITAADSVTLRVTGKCSTLFIIITFTYLCII